MSLLIECQSAWFAVARFRRRGSVDQAVAGGWSLGAFRRVAGLIGVACLMSACQSREYLQASEQRYGVGDSWYGSDLRVYHDALLSPASMKLHNPGYIIGVEELHPNDASFVADGGDRYVEHTITHIMRYGVATDDGVSAASACVIFSLLEAENGETDPGHGIFTHCPAARGEAESARISGRRDVADEPDDCARTSYGRLDESKLTTLPVAQGEAIRSFHQSLCHQLATGEYSHIVVMVMGWNTNQSLAFKNFNSIVNNIGVAAQERPRGSTFRPLIVGITWPSELDIGPGSVLPQQLVHLSSFFSKREKSEDVGRYVLSDLLRNILDARATAGKLRGDSNSIEPRIVMIGHSFGARTLVNALTHPIIGAEPALGDGQAEIRRAFADIQRTDRLFLLQGAVDFGNLFVPESMDLAGTIGDGRPRVTMTASEHDSANNLAFWGNYIGTMRAFRQACEDPANKDVWQSAGYHLDGVGCAIIDGGSDRYGFGLCRGRQGPETPPPIPRCNGRSPTSPSAISTRVAWSTAMPPFTGGGSHSDIFRLETARFMWDEMQ